VAGNLIRSVDDAPLPLFAAASAREAETVREINEPAVALRPMTAGSEVVEDYSHVGLTLRNHPVSFLRDDLRARRIVSCAQAMEARDGRWLETAGCYDRTGESKFKPGLGVEKRLATNPAWRCSASMS
jgi:error-prone DNA polymerase